MRLLSPLIVTVEFGDSYQRLYVLVLVMRRCNGVDLDCLVEQLRSVDLSYGTFQGGQLFRVECPQPLDSLQDLGSQRAKAAGLVDVVLLLAQAEVVRFEKVAQSSTVRFKSLDHGKSLNSNIGRALAACKLDRGVIAKDSDAKGIASEIVLLHLHRQLRNPLANEMMHRAQPTFLLRNDLREELLVGLCLSAAVDELRLEISNLGSLN